MDKLIGIRGVCNWWQGLVEDICREKRSILIESKAKANIADPDLSGSFNGLVDFSKNWTILKVKPAENNRNEIALSTDLCILLGKLFPKVENLVLNAALHHITDTADSLFTLLNNWSSTLVALGLNVPNYPIMKKCIEPYYVTLFRHINNLINLKQFVFGELLQPTYNLEFLTRLEHCSFCVWNSIDAIAFLGKNCTSLHLFGYIETEQITQIPKLNAPLVKGLTHLRLRALDWEVLSFVCTNFGALQMLNIDISDVDFNADTICDLARLSKLSQLSIQHVKFDLPTLAQSNLSTLASVQTFEVINFEFENDGQPFDGDQFCRVLSFVFPNLQQLTIKHRVQLIRDEIAGHLDHFSHLRKHRSFFAR